MNTGEGPRKCIGKNRAIALAETHWWEQCTSQQIVEFQLFVAELCMPFDKFQEAVEKCLGRPVWTHEFALNYDGLVAEFLGERKAPTMDQIIELIPTEKRLVLISKPFSGPDLQ